MDPFVFMVILLGFGLLMMRMLPGNSVGTAAKCEHCRGPYGWHYPSCKRAKR